MELSKIQKLRIAVQVINDLKQVEFKGKLYKSNDNDLNTKIAKKAGICVSNYRGESGIIDIGEYIQLTRDEYEHRLFQKLNNQSPRDYSRYNQELPWDVSEELKTKTKEFEEKNIPPSGYCNTWLGEIFRAMQRIQYRRHNDGDIWFIINSPTFPSYLFLVSEIDKLNYSSKSYNESTGEYSFEFTDGFLKKESWNGKVSDCIEHPLAADVDFIKFQLMDLLLNGKIKDEPNEYDSRSFTPLKKKESNWY